MSKITIGITELHEILGRDYGIEEYYTLGILGWERLPSDVTAQDRVSTLQLLVRSNGKTAYHRFSAELGKESTRTVSLIISWT